MIESSAILLLLAVASGVGVSAPASAVADSPATHDSLAAPGLLGAAPDTLAAPHPVLTLPEVRVERERALPEARAKLPTAHTTELRAGAAGRAHETLPELLREAAGARVVQYGGFGAFATLSLRGSPSGQVAVLLDGVPLGGAGRTVVNLADLPVTAIERVEVYRGVAPLWLAAPGPAGAVNFVTVGSPAIRDARLTRGSFDTWEGRATTGASRGPLALLLHAGYQGSDGDFRYPDDNGTPFNAGDDSLSPRVNNRFDAGSLLATGTWRGFGTRASLQQEVFHKAQGVPGIGTTPTRTSNLTLDRARSVLALDREATPSWPGGRIEASLMRERSRFRDLDSQLGLGRHDTDDRLLAEGMNATLESPRLPLGLALRASGSLRRDRARLSDVADGMADPPESRRTARGAALDADWRPFGTWLMLHAGRRWDRIEDALRYTGTGGIARRSDVARVLDSPQLGARLAWGGFEARANWSEAERAPDFLELFGNQGSVRGNPDLVPERNETRDAGLAWTGRLGRRGRASLEWAHFESRPRDLIHYLRLSQSSVRAVNLTAARIGGDEVSALLDLAASVSARVSLTRQSAVDDGEVPFWHGKRLPLEPARQAYARLGWSPGALRLGADLHYIGDNYLDRYNRSRVSSRTIVGATLGWHTRAFALVVEGKNLGDNQLVDVGGFPLPGRSAFVTISTHLGAPAGDAAHPIAGVHP